MPVAERAGHVTRWTSMGEGDRPVLGLHCFFGHARSFQSLAKGLPENTITSFDFPSHGGSDPWVHDTGFSEKCVDIARSLLTEPMDIIGHSFGGIVGLTLAQRYPELVRSLTVVEPVLFTLLEGTDRWADHEADHSELEAAFAAGDMPRAAEAFMNVWGGGMPWNKFPEEARTKMIEQVPLVAVCKDFTHGHGLIADGVLESIQAPTTVVYGGSTQRVIPDLCERLASRISTSELVEVPGAGHMLPLTHSRQLAEIVARNISRA